MAAFTVDISRLPQSTREMLRRTLSDENVAKLAIAKANQARLAKLYKGAVGPGTTKPGIGPITHAIDPYFVSYFSRVCDAREMVWEDPEFIRWLGRQDDSFSVPEAPTKLQVGYRKAA